MFAHYIQDSPVAQLDSLAIETSAKLSISEAKLQIQDLLRRRESLQTEIIATPPADMMMDCEAAEPETEETTPVSSNLVGRLIQNQNPNGKLHRPLDCNQNLHPREWRTRCGWRFGRVTTDYAWVCEDDAVLAHHSVCSKCFPEIPRPSRHSSSSSSSSSSAHSARG